MKELKVEAKDENLSEVLGFLDGELEAIDCPLKIQMQLDVAVEELYVNIAHYAYAPETGKAIIGIETGLDPARITIVFKDCGKPFDPTAKADPDITLSAQERQIGGLGIYMAKKAVDEMKYEYVDGQNILTLSRVL